MLVYVSSMNNWTEFQNFLPDHYFLLGFYQIKSRLLQQELKYVQLITSNIFLYEFQAFFQFLSFCRIYFRLQLNVLECCLHPFT